MYVIILLDFLLATPGFVDMQRATPVLNNICNSVHKAASRLPLCIFRSSQRSPLLPPTPFYSSRVPLLRPITSSRFLTYSAKMSNGDESARDIEKEFHGVDKGNAQTDHDGHPASHQMSSSTEGKHDWKLRPPYRIHEPNEDFKAVFDASCHCGNVQYELSREEPLDSKLCHCTTCQTQHGE